MAARAKPSPHMLLNVSHVKDYVKEAAEIVRPGWIPTQVSDEAITMLNEKVKKIVRDSLRQHPTKGSTFKQVL